MHTFRVWATIPTQVELAFRGHRLPMNCGEYGWWILMVHSAAPGDDYGFLLDGEGPFPDPRSQHQPNGVHGLSRLVDASEFKWTDAGFEAQSLSAAVIYELHIGTFTDQGTFEAAADKLDHLVRLGVTHVEIMPVAEFPGNHGWGYDGVDLFAPHHGYGGPDRMKGFVDSCHARGLAVLLDVVYNHLGPSGNYLARFGPYFDDRSHTPWGPAVNFDGPHSDEVRRFFCDNALFWLRDYHLDGLRLDAVDTIFDMSARHFLEQLGDEADQLSRQTGRRLVLIAESDLNDPRLIQPRECGGYSLAAQWSDDFHHALHAMLTGERMGYYADFGALAHLAKALRNAYVYDGQYSAYRRRRHGRPPEGLSGHQFLGYAQTHDQVGNRPGGERLSQLVNVGRTKIASALVFTAPFVPMLFQGEEWATSAPFQYFTDHAEADLARDVREGRKKDFASFGWHAGDVPDPQGRETYERSKLNWSELHHPPHSAMLDWYCCLIRLRRSEAALSDGRLDQVKTRFDESARWFTMERGPITVAFNLAGERQDVPVRLGPHELLLAADGEVHLERATLSLPPDSIAILKQQA